MTNVAPTILSTVSSQFVDDWLAALRALCTEEHMATLPDLPVPEGFGETG